MTGGGNSDISLLLVDDREQNLLALAAILEPLGYHLETAASGRDALKQLLLHDVSVILLDIRMPDMDGYETAEHIKRRERTSDIPIIFLTAEAAESEHAIRAFSAGAVDFVTKPFEPWALRAKVQVFVDLAEKTRLLREQGDALRRQLDEQYATETTHLRKLTGAALAINSTQSLEEMLAVLNDAARETIRSHAAATVITADPELRWPEQSQSLSPKYAAWAATSSAVDTRPLYDMVLHGRSPVRMTKREIAAGLASRGVSAIDGRHPLLEGWMAVPLLDRAGATLGLIQVADKVDGDFDDQDELVLVQLAQLAAVAIGNARRYHQEHAVAHTLQRSMLPAGLPVVPGVAMAARYRAGSAGTEVGGDWYDAVVLPSDELLLMVGDVVGRGPAAAAVMGQLRTGFRAYALQQFPLTVLMRSLDLLLQSLSDGMMATAVGVVVDAERRGLDVVTAGHPPPLLLGADGSATFVASDSHTPLGVVPAPLYAPARVRVPPRSTLVLYTDGLVEDRDVTLDDGLRRLAASARQHVAAGVGVEELCDELLEELVGAGSGDDVALLVVHFG